MMPGGLASSARRVLRVAVMMTVLAVITLLAFGAMALRSIEAEHRRNISTHLLTTLDTVTNLIELLQDDETARVRVIAQDPVNLQIADALTRRPGNPELIARLERWMTPIYRSRGFEGYSLIRSDGLIVAASSPAYIGKPVSTDEARDALALAERRQVGVSRPTAAVRPVVRDGLTQPVGTVYQLACSRIDEGPRLIGYLCLRTNPQIRLFKILQAGRVGESGEAYLIDEHGRILSPSRFETAAHESASIAQEAREPATFRKFTTPGEADRRPLTRIAQNLLAWRKGTTGYVENYHDYRGVPVIGAGRWFEDTGMGLIVEEDLAESFRSYHFSRNVVMTMVCVAIMLILVLSYLHVRTRRSLAESAQRLRAFRDNAPIGMSLRDRNGVYLMVNPIFEKNLGMTQSDALGKTDHDLFPPRVARLREAELMEVLATGRVFSRISTQHEGTDREVVFHIIRFPIYGHDDVSIIAVGGVAIDITEQVKAQTELEALAHTLELKVAERTRELEEARELAEAGARAKAEFLANMSHEIRTPLNAVIGMSHLAVRINADAKVDHYLNRIVDAGQHLLGIVNDILDFSRIEAGKLALDSNAFSLQRMLEHVTGLVWEKADAKGLELIIDVAPGIPDRLLGDSLHLGQVLINFVNNAVKFTDEGEVTLRVTKTAQEGDALRLRFDVIDTGIGIAPDKLSLLFQPFQQVDGSMNRRFEGTGLGLIISKKLAELMGGDVAVSSRPGSGSVFSVELPLRAVDEPRVPLPAGVELKGRTALIVDDNEHARGLLAEGLRTLSFDVEEVSAGQAAVDRVAGADARDSQYDVVFVDWKMPGMDGHDTAVQIGLLSLGAERPRMVLVAPASERVVAQADTLFDAVLVKPVSSSDLCDVLANVFGARTPRAQLPVNAAPEFMARQSVAHQLAAGQFAGRRILLVEDNDINREVARDLLELVGLQVVAASDGLQALQILHGERFDAVLMDVQMPVMNGMEATRKIRAQGRFEDLPVIALTANALDGDRDRCIEAGMSDYVAKPIDPDRLFETLARWLSSPSFMHAEPAEEPSGQTGNDARGREDIWRCLPDLDVSIGLKRLMGREDLYEKLVQRVLDERGDQAERMREALKAGDMEELGRLAHGLKSILGTLGATALQAICGDIEEQAAAGSLSWQAFEIFEIRYQALLGGLRLGAEALQNTERLPL